MRLFAVKWPETLRNGRVLTREDLPIALRQPSWFEEDAIAARPFEAIQRGCGGFRSLLVSQESRCHAENLVVILQNLVNFEFRVKENVLRRAARLSHIRQTGNGAVTLAPPSEYLASFREPFLRVARSRELRDF